MRLVNFSEKRHSIISSRNDEDIVFKRMCTIDGPILLKYMMNICSQKCGLPSMSIDGYEIVFDRVFFRIQNLTNIIFIYGPNGMHPPEFHIYRQETKRVKIVPYRFWEDQGLSRLLPVVAETAGNKAAQTIGKDPFSCIVRYLGIRDLLICRIVCRQWRYNLTNDSIWNARLPAPIPGYTGLAAIVKCAVLIQDFQIGWMSNDMQRIILANINTAWMHRYRRLLDLKPGTQHQPGVLFTAEDEYDVKKRRVRLIASAKQLLCGISKTHNSVRASKAGCLQMYENHSSGATCWITPKTNMLTIGKLKGVKPYETKIQRLHEMMLNWMDSLYFGGSP